MKKERKDYLKENEPNKTQDLHGEILVPNQKFLRFRAEKKRIFYSRFDVVIGIVDGYGKKSVADDVNNRCLTVLNFEV